MRLRKKVAKFGDNKEKQSHGRFSREFSGHLAARTRERNFLESFATPLQDQVGHNECARYHEDRRTRPGFHCWPPLQARASRLQASV